MDELINLLLLAAVKRIPEPVWQWYVKQKGVVRAVMSFLFFAVLLFLAAGLVWLFCLLIKGTAA